MQLYTWPDTGRDVNRLIQRDYGDEAVARFAAQAQEYLLACIVEGEFYDSCGCLDNRWIKIDFDRPASHRFVVVDDRLFGFALFPSQEDGIPCGVLALNGERYGETYASKTERWGDTSWDSELFQAYYEYCLCTYPCDLPIPSLRSNCRDTTRRTNYHDLLAQIEGLHECFPYGYHYRDACCAIPDGTTEIGAHALLDCVHLSVLTIPRSVLKIDSGAFSRCTALTEVRYLGSVADWCRIVFHDSPFSYAKRFVVQGALVTDVVIPAETVEIAANAFYCAKFLTTVTIAEGVTKIGRSAFENASLTALTIPQSVTEMGRGAFAGCRSLTDVVYAGTRTQWDAIVKGFEWDSGHRSCVVRCSDGVID